MTGDLFERVINKAEEIDMNVNCKKTQVVVVSPDNGCNTRAVVKGRDKVIQSSDSIRLLGYTLGSTPGTHGHIEEEVPG